MQSVGAVGWYTGTEAGAAGKASGVWASATPAAQDARTHGRRRIFSAILADPPGIAQQSRVEPAQLARPRSRPRAPLARFHVRRQHDWRLYLRCYMHTCFYFHAVALAVTARVAHSTRGRRGHGLVQSCAVASREGEAACGEGD